MKYKNIVTGTFLSRPNRFIAHVLIDGREEICHVKNTGRCRELLVKGATVFLEKSDNPARKTGYSLVTAVKNNMLINLDSQAPNAVVKEWLLSGNYFKSLSLLKPETTFGGSRFDFYAEADGERHFIEVKGVTLENNGAVSFPDAPTLRGTKHLNELVAAAEAGYKSHIFFVIQMELAREFTANRANDPDFADALINAVNHGVTVSTLRCSVTEKELSICSNENIFKMN